MKKIICSLLFVSSLLGQVVPLSSGPPTAVNTTGANVVGNLQQSATYCYWVVAIYPIGKVFPNTPGCVINGPFTLNGPHSINITWTPVTGATGYDVLKVTGSNSPPSTNCNCALVLNTTTNNVSDTGQALSNYSITTVGSASGSLGINNRDFTTPEFTFSPYLLNIPGLQFPDGTQLLTATGASLQKTGNTNIFVSAVTPVTNGQCGVWDAQGNLTSAPCGTGIGNVTTSVGLTNNLPVIGNGGSDTKIGARTGNTTTFVSSSGVLVSGNGAKWDANGNLIDSGSIPGNVTHTGALIATQVLLGNGVGDIIAGDLTGDVATSGSNVTAINPGAVSITKIAGAALTGNGLQLCTVTGALTNTAIIRFDASGNCIAGVATEDVSGNISTSGSMSTGVGGAGASYLQLKAGAQTWPGVASTTGWIGPTSIAGAGSYALAEPSALPTANQILLFPAPSSGIAQSSWVNLQLTGDVTSSLGSLATTVAKVNGVAYPASPSTHQTPIVTAANTITYETINTCTGAGKALTYDQATDNYGCNTISASGASVPLPSSGARYGGFFANSNTGLAADKGFADHFVSSGGTVSTVAANSTEPYTVTRTVTTTAANNIGGIVGDPIWRRNTTTGNNIYAESRVSFVDQTSGTVAGLRVQFCFTSNTQAVQMASVSPAGDYACLAYDSATNAGKWFCTSATAGTNNIVNGATAADANPHLLQISLNGATDGNFTAKVDGVDQCSATTTDLPTSGTFLRSNIAIDNLATGHVAQLDIGPYYVQGGNN